VTISSELMHLVANRAQNVLGYIELAEIERDPRKRKKWFDRAREELHDLTATLQAQVERTKPKL
jgi:hypothetical protein